MLTGISVSRALLVVLIGSAGACSDLANDIAADYRVTPLRALRGVTMNMPVRRLRVARPRVTFVPSVGFRETVDGLDVLYTFLPGAVGERETPETGKAPLAAIYLTRTFASSADADASWRDMIGKVSASEGPPRHCEEFGGASPGKQARWVKGSTGLTIAAVRPTTSGIQVIPDRLVFAVVSTTNSRLPENSISVSCPSAQQPPY